MLEKKYLMWIFDLSKWSVGSLMLVEDIERNE